MEKCSQDECCLGARSDLAGGSYGVSIDVFFDCTLELAYQ